MGGLIQILGSIELLASISVGALAGLLAGALPGLNGRIGLLLALPLALSVSPLTGAVFLIAMHSVVNTSGSIPAVLFGAPTSASEAATVIDGYPMARKGQGGRAIGAVIMASLVGGVLGAFGLMAFAPLAHLIVPYLGTPEVAALSCLGLLTISALAGGGLSAGVAVAALGMLIATVGVEPMTATPRYVFGQLELWNGVSLVAVITGLFAIPELIVKSSETKSEQASTSFGDMLRGCRETLTHIRVLIRSSIIGFIVGFIPGIGAGAAVWIAYGDARRQGRPDDKFGDGAIAGIIAPEAANNSKEGGALAPTLMFGVPATSSMAILAGAFAAMGFELGPRLVSHNPQIIETIGWTVVLANVVAVPFTWLIAPGIAHLAAFRRAQVIPFAMVACIAATLFADTGIMAVVQLGLFSTLGILLNLSKLPRPPLLLGLVMGPLLESTLLRSWMVYGTDAFMRPGVLLIVGGAITVVLTMKRRLKAEGAVDENYPASGVGVLVAIAAVFCAAVVPLFSFSMTAAIAPALAIGFGLLAVPAAVVVRFTSTSRTAFGARLQPILTSGFLVLLCAIYPFGLPVPAACFIAWTLIVGGHMSAPKALTLSTATGAILHFVQVS